jgi:hypothetical protein
MVSCSLQAPEPCFRWVLHKAVRHLQLGIVCIQIGEPCTAVSVCNLNNAVGCWSQGKAPQSTADVQLNVHPALNCTTELDTSPVAVQAQQNE